MPERLGLSAGVERFRQGRIGRPLGTRDGAG
jgi:hypothetical protein